MAEFDETKEIHEWQWGLITSSRSNAQRLATEFNMYLDDYYGSASADLRSILGTVLDDGHLQFSSPDEQMVLKVNELFPHVARTIATIVPPNPKVEVRANRQGADEEDRQALAAAARIREATINDNFRKETFHRDLRRASAIASLMGHSVVFQKWNSEDKVTEYEPLTPIEAWFDLRAPKWKKINWLVRVSILDKLDAKELVHKVQQRPGLTVFYEDPNEILEELNFSQYPQWLARYTTDDNRRDAEQILGHQSWVAVYDFYDFRRNTLTKWIADPDADGMPESPLFSGPMPSRLNRNPAMILTLNDNLRTLAGVPDPMLIEGAREHQTQLDSLGLHHARTSMTVLFALKDRIANYDDAVNAWQSAGSQSIIPIELDTNDANVTLDQVLKWSQTPSMNPDVQILRDRAASAIQRTLAIPDHAPGVGGDKRRVAATAFALADAEVKTQAAPRAAEVLELIAWAGEAHLRNLAEYMPSDAVLHARYGETSQNIPQELAIATRETLRLPTLAITLDDSGEIEQVAAPEKWKDEYAYLPIPYSGHEGTRFARLRMLQENLPDLRQSPDVDQRALTAELLETLQVPHLLMPKQEPLPGADGMMPPGGPGPLPPGDLGGGGAPIPPNVMAFPGEDSTATGALPAGAAPVDAGQTPMGGPGMKAPLKGPLF